MLTTRNLEKGIKKSCLTARFFFALTEFEMVKINFKF